MNDNICTILDLEGFFIENTFIVRELGYYTWRGEFARIAFYMKTKWTDLSPKEKATVFHVKYRVNGLTYEQRKGQKAFGYHRVEEITRDLYESCKSDRTTLGAYKGGHVERDLLNSLKVPRVNLEMYGCPKYDRSINHLF